MRCSLGSILRFSRCFYWKHHIKPFGLGGAIKPGDEEGDLLSELFSDNGVCRAAPGFAQVCSLLGILVKIFSMIFLISHQTLSGILLGTFLIRSVIIGLHINIPTITNLSSNLNIYTQLLLINNFLPWQIFSLRFVIIH